MLILASVWLDEACSIEQVLGTSILVLGVLVAKVPVLDNVCMYDRMLEASARQAQPQTIIFRVQPRRLPTSPKLKTKQFAFGKLPKKRFGVGGPSPPNLFSARGVPDLRGAGKRADAADSAEGCQERPGRRDARLSQGETSSCTCHAQVICQQGDQTFRDLT